MRVLRMVAGLLATLSLAACSSSATNDNANANGGTAGSSAGTGGSTSGSGGSADFPLTPVIDDFEYTGPATAEKWTPKGGPNNWTANGVLTSTTSDPTTLFTLATLGAKQEAFMQITKLPPSGGVYLFFSAAACESSYVKYDPTGHLHVGSEAQAGVCTDFDIANDPLVLHEGDQLGVRTRDDNQIEVYVNGELFKSYSFIATDGAIGIGADLTGAGTGASVSIDNFGGGNLP